MFFTHHNKGTQKMSIGIPQMSSLISAQNTLKNIETISATRTSVNGSSKILASEIKIDQKRGVDTTAKEASLAEIDERLKSIDENINNNIANLNEKIREGAAAQETQPTANDKTEHSNASGITEPVDVVEISAEGQSKAEALEVNIAPVSAPSSPSLGQAIDLKV